MSLEYCDEKCVKTEEDDIVQHNEITMELKLNVINTVKAKEKAVNLLPSIQDFIFIKPISRGAFGKVYLGSKKTAAEKVYAIKVMKKADLFNKNLMKQVTTERDALATSYSPFVVNLFYSLQSEQNIYLIMEYMIGGDVKSLLTMYGYFDEEMAKMYIAEVILALEYLNEKGIVHRDLKPDNMLISNEGHIKLTDFGLSKINIDVGSASSNIKQLAVNYHRTPGQILSLKSSLAFSVTASMRKRKYSTIKSPLVTKTSSRSVNSPLKEAVFSSPLLKQHPEMSPIAMRINPRKSGNTHATHATPPIKCLTPTLEDSLNWTTTDSDASYMTDNNRSLYSTTKPISNLATRSDDTAISSQITTRYEISTAESIKIEKSSENTQTVKLVELSAESRAAAPSTASSSQESSMDDTPQLHLSNESVWNSYAARNLRSMREGSYSEDSGEETGKTCDIGSPLFRPKAGKYSIGKKNNSASIWSESYASSSGKSSIYGYHSDDEMDFSCSKLSTGHRKRGFDSLCESNTKGLLKSGLTGDFGVLKMMGNDPRQKRPRLDPDDSKNESHNSDVYAADISCDNSMNDGIVRCRECTNTSSEDFSMLETSVESFYSTRSRHQSAMSVQSFVGGNSTMFLSPVDENLPPRPSQLITDSRVIKQKNLCFNTDLFKSPLPQTNIRTKTFCSCDLSERSNHDLHQSNNINIITPDQSIKKQMGSFHTPRTPANMKKTPFKTPFKNQIQTPYRTPKSVRRGPQNEEEERILGTPDYLAPEILMQKPHGSGVDWWALGVCLFEFLTGIPPFNDQTPDLVFQNILSRDIPWPEDEEALSDAAKSAIDELLTMDPSTRPEASGVKSMVLFADVDWDHVLETEPAFVPQPDDQLDTTYFDARNKVQQLVVSAVDL